MGSRCAPDRYARGRLHAVPPRIEYFARIGPAQQHSLAPMVSVRWKGGWWWQIRGLVALSDGSDEFVGQSLLSCEFPTLRPSRQVY
jgi:hypothetical protein